MTATPTSAPLDTGDDHEQDDHEQDDHSATPRRRWYRASDWAGLVVDIVCAGA